MAHENKVLRSMETPGRERCVDLFQRPGGTFGYEEYRRELEDGRGWYPIGFYAERLFTSEKSALDDAVINVSWLKDVLGSS